jgi:hypothetical protein
MGRLLTSSISSSNRLFIEAPRVLPVVLHFIWTQLRFPYSFFIFLISLWVALTIVKIEGADIEIAVDLGFEDAH